MAANVDDTVVTGLESVPIRLQRAKEKKKYHRGVYLRFFEREEGSLCF